MALRVAWYRTVKSLFGGTRGICHVVSEHLGSTQGQRVLDVGCGFADLRQCLDADEYVGVESDDAFVQAGARYLRPNDRLVNGDARRLSELGLGEFDVVVALGFLHHLNDDDALVLLQSLRSVLLPTGRFFAIEPLRGPGQSVVERALYALDRGDYIRDEAAYLQLVQKEFPAVELNRRHRSLPLPYSHAVFVAAASPA